jgi:hypothetical protein
MYWFNSNVTTLGIYISGAILLACLPACKPDVKETGATVNYFDLKGYFDAEAVRLSRANKTVLKTVVHNTNTESKKVKITNWARELDLFTGSDINRPAWKNSYRVISSGDILFYKAKYPELKMREMVIKKDKLQVRWVLIFNRNKNILYQTNEKLSYFPDSLYLIEKTQKIRLMGSNEYVIKGIMRR